MKPHWYPDWSRETCVLVASGPSAKDVNLEPARGRARFIAINSSWQLAPWADILYACDAAWWRAAKGAPDFSGLKVTQDKVASDEYPFLKRVICERHHENLVIDRPGFVGWGGNSGFHSLNLAVQFGCKKVILVGFDMHLNNGSHWHGDHQTGMTNPTSANVSRWRKTFDGAAPTLKQLGVVVRNTSMVSALSQYPKMSIEEALL